MNTIVHQLDAEYQRQTFRSQIVVSTIDAVALAGRRDSYYLWLLLIGASALSVTANAIHASLYATRVAPWLASLIAAVPPLVLLASTHLTVVLGRVPANAEPAAPNRGRSSGVRTGAAKSNEPEPPPPK